MRQRRYIGWDRTTLSQVALKILSKIGESSLDLISQSFLSPKYSFTHPSRKLLGIDHSRTTVNTRSLSVVLSKLRQEGLVEKIGNTRNARWRITSEGKHFLEEGRNTSEEILPKQDGKLRIVMFDIPEKERGKRQWVRGMLVVCGYELLQKSVWLGRRPLPQSFLEDAEDLGALKYLHILEISRRGTIKEV